MRQARLLLNGKDKNSGQAIDIESDGYYYCASYLADKSCSFGEEEKNHLHDVMRRVERFSGVEVVTYCFMSDYIHLLIRVPAANRLPKMEFSELESELQMLHGIRKGEPSGFLQEFEQADASGSSMQKKKLLEKYELRRGSLGSFMKEFKQRFTQWFNGKQNRRGTLWDNRFKSTIVQPTKEALMVVAAYIDLDPLREGLVSDPADYPWCGYAEAMSGNAVARRGLTRIFDQDSIGTSRSLQWKTLLEKYQPILFNDSTQTESHEEATADDEVKSDKKGRKKKDQKPLLPISELLRSRSIRYFGDGAIFGDTEFIEALFEANRERYGPKRKSGAREMKGAKWGKLRVLRDLRKNVIE
ncbi:MAG: transposase [Chthoniobacterales bacterium]